MGSEILGDSYRVLSNFDRDAVLHLLGLQKSDSHLGVELLKALLLRLEFDVLRFELSRKP